MKKNDLVELTIHDITNEGYGIGKVNDMAVFVPLSANGDKILARILKVKKNYAYGKIEKIIEKSPDRIEIDCEHYAKCGGCVFRHISYESELKLKQKIVSDCIRRIGGFNDIQINDIVKADNPNYYRNKVQIPVREVKNNIIAGFFSIHSHRIVPINICKLQPPIFQEIINTIKEWMREYRISAYDETKNQGIIRHIYLRSTEDQKEILTCIVINGKNLPNKQVLVNKLMKKFSQIKSIVINLNFDKTNVILGEKFEVLTGNGYITDTFSNYKFRISSGSFYQVNKKQAEKLYKIAADMAELKPNDILIDLYCGVGTIGIFMSKYVSKVVGIEISKSSIIDAKNNAKANNIDNIQFINSDAENIKKYLIEKQINPDIIIIDPPRKGCSQNTIKNICELSPNKIIYISCNPATLARDLKSFEIYKYSLKNLTPVDMFPKTGHVETVVLLGRKKSTDDIVYGYVDYEPKNEDYVQDMKGNATYSEIKDWIKD